MKKILAVIGSPNNSRSNTVTMTRDFITSVNAYGDAAYEIISLGESVVNPCRGCWACMKTGACVHKTDALQEVMRKIRECDLLIVGSPVYEQQISAQLKAFFDRTFMWIHLIGLMGKPVITALTTGNDGLIRAENYLTGMLTMMGCIPVGHLRGIGKQPGVFPDRERCREKYRPLARKTARLLNGEARVRPGIFNRVCFAIMKHHTRSLLNAAKGPRATDPAYTGYEHRYWQEKGWFRMSYRGALRAEQSRPALGDVG